MAQQDEMVRSPGLGERGAEGTLSALLAMTGDAVVCFDETGTILLANDEALRLLAPVNATQATTALVGADVRLLFPPAVGVVPDAPFSTNSLPLPLDGSTTRLLRTDGTGHVIPLMARCTPVSAPGGMYLLVARSDASTVAADREHERLVEELSLKNRLFVLKQADFRRSRARVYGKYPEFSVFHSFPQCEDYTKSPP